MKQFLLIAILTLLVFAVGAAQPATTIYNAGYANSQVDTTVVAINNIGSWNKITLLIDAPDSMNVKTYLDTKTDALTAWTLKDSITVNSLTVPHNEWILRSMTVDITGGFQKLDIRFRRVYAGSGNTLVSTQKSTNTLIYSK